MIPYIQQSKKNSSFSSPPRPADPPKEAWTSSQIWGDKDYLDAKRLYSKSGVARKTYYFKGLKVSRPVFKIICPKCHAVLYSHFDPDVFCFVKHCVACNLTFLAYAK